MPENALPSVQWSVPLALDRAGTRKPKSSRLCSSLAFGKRQAPATLLSVRPQLPLARVLAAVRAWVHVTTPKQLAFFSQIQPVKLSRTVPSPRSVKRGMGHSTPSWRSPSSPVVNDVVSPVWGTGAGGAGCGAPCSPWAKVSVPKNATEAAITVSLIAGCGIGCIVLLLPLRGLAVLDDARVPARPRDQCASS